MKLLVIADFHGRRDRIRDVVSKVRKQTVDAVVVCGDLTNFGPAELGILMLGELAELGLPILFVPGNCDPRKLAEVRAKDVVNLHGRCEQIGGYWFVGVGGSNPTPFRTPFELTEEAISEMLKRNFSEPQDPRRVVVVTHAPPHGTKVDRVFAGLHAGSKAIREFVRSKQPLLVLCAHIHEGRGIDLLGSTCIVNPGPATRGFCAIVNLDGDVTVTLDRLG